MAPTSRTPASPTTIDILSIGNEILLGDVLDSNSNWLCQQITGRGGHMRRVVQVRDEPEAIGRELHRSLQDGTGLILTTGGLGPTDDDITLQAVAEALGRPLEEHPEALEMIRRRYRGLSAHGYSGDLSLTPARRKMAWLPQGGRPLHNPAGSAPGVLLREGGTTLICLPGVPTEMKAIFQDALSEVLQELLGQRYYTEKAILVRGSGESTLAPLLRRVVAAHPEVYVKSRAQHYEPGAGRKARVLVTMSLSGENRGWVEEKLAQCLRDLLAALSEVEAETETLQPG